MTQENKYKLNFYNKKIDGKVYSICGQINSKPTDFSVLSFIDGLSIFEIESFIIDLEECLQHENNGNLEFRSDGVEHMTIKYNYPQVDIDGVLIISMSELKKLLVEWLNFVTQ